MILGAETVLFNSRFYRFLKNDVKSKLWLYSRRVTITLATAKTYLITRFMEHHMLGHSLHFNDYRSEIK